jgi:hypothetical protein
VVSRYFDEPYTFIPPYRGKFWLRLARPFGARYLRRRRNVHRTEFRGTEHLEASLKAGAGILMTPNHCRWADGSVMLQLGFHLRREFFFLISAHLFRQSGFMPWLLRRMGCFSIWREGLDRDSLKNCSEILSKAERPLVLFPEGTWFRTNDKLGPFQEGLTLILNQALKGGDRPLHVLPVAMKYWLLADPWEEIDRRITILEKRLGWHPHSGQPPRPRLEKLGSAHLAIREIEYLGTPQVGTIDERIAGLAQAIVGSLEETAMGKVQSGHTLERIRRVRQRLARKLLDPLPEEERRATHEQLERLLFCENLRAHSQGYVRELPTPERIAETLQRLEETLDDQDEKPIAPLGVVVQIGKPLDARALLTGGSTSREGGNQLLAMLTQTIQKQLDALNAEGPPRNWPGFPRVPLTELATTPTHSPTPTPAGRT